MPSVRLPDLSWHGTYLLLFGNDGCAGETAT
jgi:hypothetical protein